MDESRDRARVTEHHIENTAYTKYPGNYTGQSDEWNLENFKKTFNVNIVEYNKGRELEIDLIGLWPAIANAYRRIMLAEVPTMAIEHCFIYNNTSVIQDEMLAHRLGLIPIRADPTKFKWKPKNLGPENSATEHSIVFSLKAKCHPSNNSDPDKTGRREDLFLDYKIFSGHLKWEPLRGQDTQFRGRNEIRPVHRKVLIAKLSDRQEIDMKLHAIKGIGRDHAKFSPVATASYRLLPEIRLISKITGTNAIKLQKSFADGVIALEGKDKVAKVVNARIDSGSRNVFRYPDLKDKVTYDLIKDHFIFKIESTGCMPALDILLQSCDILEYKCEYFLRELQTSRSRINEFAPMVESI